LRASPRQIAQERRKVKGGQKKSARDTIGLQKPCKPWKPLLSGYDRKFGDFLFGTFAIERF
jgi:hypothetical protein